MSCFGVRGIARDGKGIYRRVAETYFLAKTASLNPTDPHERVFVLIDVNARTGQRLGCGGHENGVLGAYGRRDINDDGTRLETFAATCKLALTNTFFSTRKGGISHSHDGIGPN